MEASQVVRRVKWRNKRGDIATEYQSKCEFIGSGLIEDSIKFMKEQSVKWHWNDEFHKYFLFHFSTTLLLNELSRETSLQWISTALTIKENVH